MGDASDTFQDPQAPQVMAILVFLMVEVMFLTLGFFSLTKRGQRLSPRGWETLVVAACVILFALAALFDFRYMAQLFEWDDPWPGYEMRTDGHLVLVIQGVFSCIP